MKIRPLTMMALMMAVLALIVPAATAFAQPQSQEEAQQMWDEAQKLFQDKQYDRAADLYIKLAEGVPPSDFKAACYYNASCAFSLKGDKRKGAVYFAHAARAGFRDMEHIVADTDLTNIRNEALYKHVAGLITAQKFAELDGLNVAELERRFYENAQAQPTPGNNLTPEQKEKLEALRRELYDRIEKEVAAMRERLRKQVDEALAGLGAGSATPTPTPGAEPATLGLEAKDLTPSLREFMGIPAGQGLIVMTVEENGPAAKAGIEKLDVLLSIDGKNIGSLDQLKEVLAALRAGQTVAVVVMRSGQTKTLQVTLGKAGAANTPAPEKKVPYSEGGYIGVSLREADNGMHVGGVVPNSPAAQAGILEGDVIAKINGEAVANMEQLRAALTKTFIGDTVEVIIVRNGEEKKLSMVIGRRQR